MEIDVAHLIGAVTRELSTRDRDGARAYVLAATRTYGTARDDLWDAITNPDRISRWFLPVSGELRPGGTYQLQGNAGGGILTCEPPARLELTWGMHGATSRVTVELSESPAGGTELRLEHTAHVPEEMWRQFGPGAVGIGWDQALLALARHCDASEAGAAAADPAWLASEEGRAFVHLSSGAWCEASIAAGADPEAARAGAERVTAMYAGA